MKRSHTSLCGMKELFTPWASGPCGAQDGNQHPTATGKMWCAGAFHLGVLHASLPTVLEINVRINNNKWAGKLQAYKGQEENPLLSSVLYARPGYADSRRRSLQGGRASKGTRKARKVPSSQSCEAGVLEPPFIIKLS